MVPFLACLLYGDDWMTEAVGPWEAKAGDLHRGGFNTFPPHSSNATGHPVSTLSIQHCGWSLLLLLSRLCVGLVASLQGYELELLFV